MADRANEIELLDAGVRRRLERFGPLTIDRPAPAAEGFRLDAGAWATADLRFDPGPGWSGRAWPAAPWRVEVEGLTLELRPTASGGIGVYPEHAGNVGWLEAQVGRASVSKRARGEAGPPEVLNLFAHTGLATLALARAGAAVTHVDGARSVVAWARRNAEVSGLADRPVRWLVDDAGGFVAREARRGRRYDGIVLDPPAFGRGRGREWRLEDDLPELLAGCRTIATDRAFVLLTAHAEGLDGQPLREMLAEAFARPRGAVDLGPLELHARSGARVHLGWAARLGA